MLTIIPETGAPYTVHNGRITSHEDGSIVTNAPFLWVVPPIVGHPAEYYLKGSNGTITTKPIAAIYQGEEWNHHILNDRNFPLVAGVGRSLVDA